MLYQPCFECLNRYGHSYTKECDTTCAYASEVAALKQRLNTESNAQWKVIINKPDWLEDDVEEYWQCSNCGSNMFSPTNFCPSCGAAMTIEEEKG